MKFFLNILFAFSLLLCVTSQLYATEVEWKTLLTLSTDTPPLDVAIPSNGQNMFVLSEGGNVTIYDSGGKIEGSMQVPPTTSGIEVTPNGDTLFLRDRTNKTVQVVSVHFIVGINTDGSPTKGPSTAKIQIAIYNDFQ